MFTKTAEYYDALYHFKDYKAASDKLSQLIHKNVHGARTLLDVGCGSGKHLEYLSETYAAEGLDLNPELLDVARLRCPSVTFHEADMTNFSLSTSFDAVVCLFSSIGYVQSVENLRKAVKCMVDHVNPGGLILIEPWIEPEKYLEGKIATNYVDQPDLKIAWMYVNERKNLTSVFDIQYMVGADDGVSCFTEKHIMGLWTTEEYREAFDNAGIHVNYDPVGLFGRGMYYGLKNV